MTMVQKRGGVSKFNFKNRRVRSEIARVRGGGQQIDFGKKKNVMTMTQKRGGSAKFENGEGFLFYAEGDLIFCHGRPNYVPRSF